MPIIYQYNIPSAYVFQYFIVFCDYYYLFNCIIVIFLSINIVFFVFFDFIIDLKFACDTFCRILTASKRDVPYIIKHISCYIYKFCSQTYIPYLLTFLKVFLPRLTITPSPSNFSSGITAWTSVIFSPSTTTPP